MPRKVEISHKTIIFTVIFLISVWFLYFVRDIILQLFLALLITAILNPMVSKLSKYKIPRPASVLLVYVVVLGVVGLSVAALVPSLLEQTSAFVNNLPGLLSNAGISEVLSDQIIQQLITQLGSLPARLARLTVSLFSNVLSVVAILVFAFYLLSERDELDDQLDVLLGDKHKKDASEIIDEIEDKLGGWARGELSLMTVVGLFNYIGLTLLGIPFALPLSILAGLLEIIPYIGPIIAALPAVLIGLGISPLLGLAVAALAFLIQQFENYVFVPKIMQKSANIHPVITLLGLAIGFRLAGIVGLLVSVPVYIVLRVISKKYVLS